MITKGFAAKAIEKIEQQ